MKIEPRAADGFCKTPPDAVRAVLVYGPNEGLVRLRAEALVRGVLGSLDDPFRLAELTGAALRQDPARLQDELAALSFGGGRRVVRLRAAEEGSAPAIAAAIESPAWQALLVIEAGELSQRSTLRRLGETMAGCAALACYEDRVDTVGAVVRRFLSERGLALSDDARDFLVERLGTDRGLALAELEKLALYLADQPAAAGPVGLAEVALAIGDGGALSLDRLAQAVARGDLAAIERGLRRAAEEGAASIAILRALDRHFLRLHLAAGLVAAGHTKGEAMARLRPPIFWADRAAFEGALSHWACAALEHALRVLSKAEAQCKTRGAPEAAILGETLLRLGRATGRRQAL